ncbi:MAG: hypothetical protein HY720_21370 [Planctomycetes bacterium]|nr:hypothetical protein [Planctomycetota bacterium]
MLPVRSARAGEAPECLALAELSELLAEPSKIAGARWRARSLLALRASAIRLRLDPPRLDAELARAFTELRSSRCAATERILVRAEAGIADAGLLEGLGRALVEPHPGGRFLGLVDALLGAGHWDEALAVARRPSARRGAAVRRTALRLAVTGIRDRRFVAGPWSRELLERFPPSIELLDAAIDIPGLARAALSILPAMRGATRQRALVPSARIYYRLGDVREALAAARSIRHASQRERALSLLAQDAFERGEDGRFLAEMRPGLRRQRCRLALASKAARRGELERAGRHLADVRSCELAARRQLVLVEIALAAGRPETAVRRLSLVPPRFAEFDVEGGIVAARLCAQAAVMAPELVGAIAARHAFLGAPLFPAPELARHFDQREVPPEDCWVLRRLGGWHLQDRFVAEWIVLRSSRLVLPERHEPVDRHERDEILSATREGWRRRRVLVRAARYALRRQAAAPGVAECRIRTLANIGGGVATNALEEALETLSAGDGVFEAAFKALAGLAPMVAARGVLRRAVDLASAGCSLSPFVRRLEERLAVEEGLTEAWSELEKRAGRPWMAEFAALHLERTGSPPSVARLEGILDLSLRASLPRPLRAVEAGLVSPPRLGDPMARVAALRRDPDALAQAMWSCPAAVARGARPWTIPDWQRVLRRIDDEPGEVVPGTVRRFAKRLAGDPRGIAARLLAGRFPSGHSEGPWLLEPAGHWLRYLDKEADLPLGLRFPDCVRCCFSSDSSMYRPRSLDTQRWVLSLWKDPLSYAFRVERKITRPPCWRPIGFVFGSYAVLEDGAPAILLNGVYLRRRSAVLRRSILETIETELARPLGIRRIGIATLHGGRGPLPESYRPDSVLVLRLRALARNGVLATRLYDDISSRVNVPQRLDHLYWRDVT